MAWLDGISGVLAVVGAAIGAAAVALILARSLHFDRFFAWLGGPGGTGPEMQIAPLAALADLAHREGVLSLEAAVAPSNDDFLIRAVSMAVDATAPEAIRRTMETEIDSAGSGGFLRSTFLRLARYPQAGTILGAGGLLTVLAVYGAEPGLAGRAAVGGLGLFFAGIGCSAIIGPIADRIAGRHAERVMIRLLQTEAVVLIRQGFDGRGVEARLRSMIPGQTRSPASLARAA